MIEFENNTTQIFHIARFRKYAKTDQNNDFSEVHMNARLNQRQQEVMNLVQRQGFVSIEPLSTHFDVTAQTIRRDINFLCDQGMLQRYHGGAGLPSGAENTAYSTRRDQHSEEKQSIAAIVAAQIPDHSSLFINIGTTNEEVARALMGHQGLRIITNNLNVAHLMSAKQDFEVIVASGVVRSEDRGVVGEATTDFISQFIVDFGIIGISGIDMDGTLLDFDYREVRVSQTIIKHSRRVFLVTDHTKFGRNAMVRLASIGEMSAIFTDQPPPAEIAEIADAAGTAIHIPSGV